MIVLQSMARSHGMSPVDISYTGSATSDVPVVPDGHPRHVTEASEWYGRAHKRMNRPPKFRLGAEPTTVDRLSGCMETCSCRYELRH